MKKNNMYICRKCLKFKEKSVDDISRAGEGTYYLSYDLTKRQKEAAKFILNEIENKRNCILSAVTGAGKTEIIYPLISYCINNGLKVCVAIPRRDVVIELKNRIEKDFKNASVISLYGGCNSVLYADVIVSTVHQLYRYNKYFDVLILDEVDAFPFYKNEMLNNFLTRSVRGNIVYMSATIPMELTQYNYNIFYLNRRYHNEKLDIPRVRYYLGFYDVKKYINKYKTGILLVYFPTIKDQMLFSKRLKCNHYIFNSKMENRVELLRKLHEEENAIILTTLVLERGVTFKNVNVVVVNADHELFSFENLVQIAGRAGRHYQYKHGDIWFLVKNKNRQITKAIKFIKGCNE